MKWKEIIMKNKLGTKLLSILLVLATLSAMLPMSVFAAEAREAEVYIKEIKLTQATTKEEAKGLLEDTGYIFLDRNLNEGTYGEGVWLGYKTTTDPSEAIYDIKLMNAKGGYTLTSMEKALESQKTAFSQMASDLNYLIKEFAAAYKAGSVPAQKAYMALNFFRVVQDETVLSDENGLGYQMVNGKITTEKLTEMILFCDASIFDSIVKILTMGIQLRTANWLERLSETGIYSKDKTYSQNETELKRRAKQVLAVLQLYAQTYNAMNAMGLFKTEAEKKAAEGTSSETASSDKPTAEQKDIANVDMARVEIYKVIFDQLAQYSYGTATLKDFFSSLDKETNEKVLYPLLSILTDGEFAALSYGCFFEMAAGATTSVSDFASYDDEFAKVTKDVKSFYIYTGVNPVLLQSDTVIGFTDEASRQMAMTGEYQFYEKKNAGDEALENGQYAALGIELAGMITMIGAKTTLFIMSVTGALATATASGATGILAGLAKVCAVIGGPYFQLAVLAIALTVALVAYIKYLVEEYKNSHLDWDKYPIPEYMYDIKDIGFISASENDGIATEYMQTTEFIFYEVVRDINNKPADLNAHSSNASQWIAMYVSYDHPGNTCKPIKANSLKVKTGNGEAPEGYTSVSRFGEVRAYDLNQFDSRDNENGIFMFYEQDNDVVVPSDRTYYIQDVIIQSGESAEHCISLLEAAEYIPLNVNLSPNYKELGFPKDNVVYTYMGYKLTSNRTEALTDIRLDYGDPMATVQYGGITYAASGHSAGVTLYVTKYTGAGTPILANSLICVNDRDEAPEGYEPINFLTGGPAQSFSLYTAGIAPWMESYFIYFLPETTFTSGTSYLGGITYYYCDDYLYPRSLMNDQKKAAEAILAYLKEKTGKDYPTSTQEECITALNDYTISFLGYSIPMDGSDHSDTILFYPTYNPYRAIYNIKGTDLENFQSSISFEGIGYQKWKITAWEIIEYALIQTIDINVYYDNYMAKDPLKMTANLYVSGNPSKDNLYNSSTQMMETTQPIRMSDIICLEKDDKKDAVGNGSAYHALTDLFSNSGNPLSVKSDEGKKTFNFYIAKETEKKPYISAVTAVDMLTLYRALGGADAGLKRTDITNGMLLAQLAGQGATYFSDFTTSVYGEMYWLNAMFTEFDSWVRVSTTKFGYTRTDNKDLALRDLFIYFGGFSTDEPPYEIKRGNVVYKMICQIPYNLTGYDGAPAIGMYLYGTTDERAGEPITELDFQSLPFRDGYEAVRTQSGRSVWSEIVDYMEAQESGHFMSKAKTLFKKLLNFFRIDETEENVNLNLRNNLQIFYILVKHEGDSLRTQKPYISELYVRNKNIVQTGKYGGYAESLKKAILDNLFDQGAEDIVNVDLNSANIYDSKVQIYLGYSRTADPNEAITALRIKHNGLLLNPHTIGDVVYHLVDFDLNDGLGGDKLHLYYTKSQDPDIGTPITDILYSFGNTPSIYCTDSAEIMPVMRFDSWKPSNLNANTEKGHNLYLSVVRPFETPMGTYEEPDYGKTSKLTRPNPLGEKDGAYIAAVYVMDKNTIRQELLAKGTPSDQCTCDKITDQQVIDRLKAMGATTVIETPINITGSEYGKKNPNKVFIGYSRTNDEKAALKHILIKTDVFTQAEPEENILVNQLNYELVAEPAKRVETLPRAINLIGTQDAQDLVVPRMYLYATTEGHEGDTPISDICIDGNPLKDAWPTVRSENGLDPFVDIYEEAKKHAELGAKDDDDSRDEELIYTDELYKWMESVAKMFDPTDDEISLFYIHCKKYATASIEDTLPYISQIFIATGDSDHEALSKLIAFNPDGFIDCDMNKGTVFGKHIFIAYKRTAEKDDAIRDLAIFDQKNPADSKRIKIGNNKFARFDLVESIDLNTGAGGDYLYLYATKTVEAGDPIINLRANNKTVSKTSGGFIEYTIKRADNNGFNKDDPDLNDGAGGGYIYLIAKRTYPSSAGSIFGTGSWISIVSLAGVALAFAAIVCIKKKRNGDHTVNAETENN